MGATSSSVSGKNTMIRKNHRVSLKSFESKVYKPEETSDLIFNNLKEKLEEHGLLALEGFNTWFSQAEKIPFPEEVHSSMISEKKFRKWHCTNEDLVYQGEVNSKGEADG